MNSSSDEDYDDLEMSERSDLQDNTDQLRPQFLNLMNEFADAEMFLIDGDSLLMEQALDKNLDWTCSGQLLHLVYLFERYLHLFVRKGGVFEIVFFQDLGKMWKTQPSIHLARNVIIEHLKANVTHKILCEFESPWDMKFQKYIKEFAPSFMLLSDGLMSKNTKQNLIHKDAPELFEHHFLQVLSLKLNIAFTNPIEFGTSTLNGFHIMYERNFSEWEIPEIQIQFYNDKSFLANEKIIENVCTTVKSNLSLLDESCQINGVIDGRLLLFVLSTCVYMKSLSSSENKVFQQDIARLILIHGVLLTSLPLKYRAYSLEKVHHLIYNKSSFPDKLKNSLLRYQFVMAEVLRVTKNDNELPFATQTICDLWDGRLIYHILFLLLENSSDKSALTLTPSQHKKIACLVRAISSLLKENEWLDVPYLQYLDVNYSKESCDVSHSKSTSGQSNFSNMNCKSRQIKPVANKDGLIHIDCVLLSEYAGRIWENMCVKKLEIDDPDVARFVVSGDDFDEIYHWHSRKPLSDDFDGTPRDASDEKDLRQRALHARYMQRYGKSLYGEHVFPAIVVDDEKKTAKNKEKTSQKSQKYKQENEEKKKEEHLNKQLEAWDQKKTSICELEQDGKFDTAVSEIDQFLLSEKEEKLKSSILVKKAEILWKRWKELCNDQKDKDVKEAKFLLLTILMLIDNKEFLKKKDKDNLARYLYAIGFGEIVIKNHLSERSFDFEDKYSLNTPSPRFQLLYLGERLRRETRTDPDKRVNHFIPEKWQRDLLDAIDNKQSALIVAPTSSGKTFVSYYCMEKVLREDNEGVVVYVSPTKALVNQVAATCATRYKKHMPPGKSVYGVFTRDYRFNALKCQILITVPQCLEILLLSPDRQDWVDKIRYVVFDEAHCIGLENDAEVWEHLFLLIRCPFLALSATIHNPRDLHSWLQNVEQDKLQRDRSNNTLRKNFPFSYNVALVTHNERYNDLEKFIYVPRLNDETEPKLEHIHPCSALNTRQLEKASQFPTHVTLSPRETMAFYDAVQEVFPEDDLVRKLSPESYFENETFISKESVRRYENDVKSKFMEFLKKNDERGEEVINKLLPETSLDVSIQDEKYRLVYHIFDLVEKLKNDNLLPVIIFSFDRKLCENFAKKIVSCLEKRENQHGGNHDGGKQKKWNGKYKKQKNDNAMMTSADETCFLVDNPPPENCSYAGKGVLDAHDANLIVQRLVKWGDKSSEREKFFKECLRRGVGYHHAGMNNKKRSAVEMLFRKKFVNVVFATGTLALGIHMPCKTVVFAGNSVFLNTLQYHQISGRAGRRGFDMIGNVIFFGIPQAKINRLMTVSLPRIIGNFPLSESLVLRLLLIVNKGKDREVALNQALTLLHNPLICKNQPELDLQLKHHFLFCVEHLVRQGLLDLKGCPQGLAGLAIHLHYHEPSNFVLLSFLRSKVLHNFCKNARERDGKFSKDFMKSLVIVLSHLFARRRLHEFLMQRPRSTSKIRLEKLPSEFEAELDKYNSNVHEVFDLYIRTVSRHVNDTLGEDITLPLSSVKLISAEDYKMNLPPISLENKLQSLSVPYKMCSSFAALSGNTDDRLYSSNDRVPNIRYQVYTDVKVVPVFPTDINLNGYVYDFFNHGNYKAVISENGLMHGEAFQLLKDFMLVLKSISVSLEEWAPENDIVRKAFVQLAQDFSSTFKKAFH